jgi:hypothetical protein
MYHTADTLRKSWWDLNDDYIATGATGFMLAGMKYVWFIPANSKGFLDWMYAEFPDSGYVLYFKNGEVPPSFAGGQHALPKPTIAQLRRLQLVHGVIVHFHKIWSMWSYFFEPSSFHMVRNGDKNMFVFTIACDQFQHAATQ